MSVERYLCDLVFEPAEAFVHISDLLSDIECVGYLRQGITNSGLNLVDLVVKAVDALGQTLLDAIDALIDTINALCEPINVVFGGKVSSLLRNRGSNKLFEVVK
jgi:hypothetical protein